MTKLPITLPLCVALSVSTLAFAQGAQKSATQAAAPIASVKAAAPPADYVIGANDQLSIVFWGDKEMSGDVVVRPDGKISLPLLNEVQAAGLTPDQLRAQLADAAVKFIKEPNVTVVVKEIKSRNVFITGNVAKPGTYPLGENMTVLQLIALAGGVQEYADSKHIVVIRKDGGREQYFHFNYKDVLRQKNPQQNIVLRPGDTVVVP